MADPAADLIDLRCSPWTRAQGVDPVGSAITTDHLLLVEWPLPWPNDVSDIPELASVATDSRARVMAVVPRADDAAIDGHLRVVHHRRVGTHRFAGVDHRVPAADVPALLARLLDDLGDAHLDWPSAVGEAPPEVLVCGHGRRDPCCGRWGTLLHAEVLARRADVRVWRCSHTGGHRFAPTAITLPDGRAWAYLDADLVDAIVERRGDPAALRGHDRGSLALDMWAQAVDREVLGRLGWSWLDCELTSVRVDIAATGAAARVSLEWAAADGSKGRAVGDVVVARTLPVLVCGEPPEAALKSSPDFEVHGFELSTNGSSPTAL